MMTAIIVKNAVESTIESEEEKRVVVSVISVKGCGWELSNQSLCFWT